MFDIAITGPLAGLVVALPIAYFGISHATMKQAPIVESEIAYSSPLLLQWMDQAVHAEPLNELTALFAEARFSEHVLGPGHRARAMSALEAARAEIMALA